MRKKIELLLLAAVFTLVLSGCSCKHDWKSATCLEAETCSLCGETQGEALGHKWQDASCIAPKTCSVCGATEGEKADHQWKEDGCINICKVCGAEDPDSPGHTWELIPGADYAKQCTTCFAFDEGIPEHDCVWLDATCSSGKTCSICGDIDGDALGHVLPGEGENVIDTCQVCRKEVETFMSNKGTLYATEFDAVVNGAYENPITSNGYRAFHWYNDGKQDSWKNDNTFCAEGKIYYRGSLLYDVSESTREDLIETAKQYISFSSAKYWDNTYDEIFLCSSTLFSGDLGEAHAVVDAFGERYILIHEGYASSDPEDTFVVKYDWRS